MNRRLALVVGSLGLVAALHGERDASARGHVWFGGGGGVRVGGFHAGGGVSGSVHWSSPPRSVYRPRGWSVGGSIYVGGYYPRYRYYRPYSYYPAYVPSYYGATYYPVEAAPATAVYTTVDPRPDLPRFGIGLFAGGVSVQEKDDSSDVGVLGRLRLTDGLLIEGELGKTSYPNDLRVDRRLGASLVYEIGARNRLAPYVLAGLGAQQADVAGTYTTTQDFAEIGVGLRYAVTDHFHVLFDVRAGSRNTVSSNDPAPVAGGVSARQISPPSEASGDNENYSRARLAAVLYF